RKEPRKDSTRENMTVPRMKALNTVSGGIIENGIKYIMLPLHLLRFCIFGTSSSESGERTETKQQTESRDKKQEKRDGEERKTEKEGREERRTVNETRNNCCRSSKEFVSSKSTDASSREETSKKAKEESSDEMVTAEEDSDSSGEQWSTARSTMPMNMSIDYTVFEEPMDISIDEQVIKISRDSRAVENKATGCVSSRSSNSSVDEEIARIFQKQCTSSEDEFPTCSFSKSFSSRRHEKPKRTNFLYDTIKRKDCPVVTRSNKIYQGGNEKERKKKTTTEFVANNKRRKVADDEDRNEKQTERKKENKPQEEKRSSQQRGTPSKSKPRSSRTPVKNKESKRKVIRFKETATQTDSAFSDDDVEMVPVDAKLSERQFCCKYAARKLYLFHGKEMEHELNYVADNEDSNDGFLRIADKRISSRSTSSSSADLGFDERVSATPDTDITVRQRSYTNSPKCASTLRSCIRAPPGFPKVPQNPPLTSYICNDNKRVILSSSNENDPNFSQVKTLAIVPPAPSPMPHLYYNYPEFMDLPISVNSSKILSNIFRNNYYR
ncbi:hypothetical protein WH47_03267, partial [Habropoda laboriosa]